MAVNSFLVVSFFLYIPGTFPWKQNCGNYSNILIFLSGNFRRCTAIDPTDKVSFRKKRRATSSGFLKRNYGFIFGQITEGSNGAATPIPLVRKDDAIAPSPEVDDILLELR
ncbi:S-acyltransferase [Quillaja saponaria]|uniref:S-acyltransferase n=1 Tax=Quillaja saponaria TaxID=32244 RepID=A0AAD7QA73_QUISA|nr:S-acyltransferase [Quillaja saponaria]